MVRRTDNRSHCILLDGRRTDVNNVRIIFWNGHVWWTTGGKGVEMRVHDNTTRCAGTGMQWINKRVIMQSYA